MGTKGKYNEALDIMNTIGIPNVELFRGLDKEIRNNFLRDFRDYFVPNASTYISTFGNSALEDVIRRLPIPNDDGRLSFTSPPDLTEYSEKESTTEKIKELCLPLKETKIFLKELGGYHDFENLRDYMVSKFEDFYKSQLDHEDIDLKWAAVRALGIATNQKSSRRQDLDNDENDSKNLKKNQYKLFKKEITPLIMSKLGLERYKNLAKHHSLIGERILNERIGEFQGRDPYDFSTLDKLLPLVKTTSKILNNYDINFTLKEFWNLENFEDIKEGMDWISNNIDSPEYQKLKNNEYFIHGINKSRVMNLLKGSPNNIPKYFNLLKDASIKLQDLSSIVDKERLEDITEIIFSYKGIYNGDETYVLDFIDVFANDNKVTKSELEDYCNEFRDFSKIIENYPDNIKTQKIDDFTTWTKLKNNALFSDFITENIFYDEIMLLSDNHKSINEILAAGYFPTPHLIDTYEKADDKKEEIIKWKKTIGEIEQGNFDLENLLMVNLEYTKYRTFVGKCSNDPNAFNFQDFYEILNSKKDIDPKNSNGFDDNQSAHLCYESSLLLKYLLKNKAESKKSGRKMIIVPNYSYGVVVSTPILDQLKDKDFEIYPARIGSTECHESNSHVKLKLFSNSVNKFILEEKPNIFIIDGTRSGTKYPDSHVGYVNYVSIINDIIEKEEPDLASLRVCKNEKDIMRLRNKQQYDNEKEYIESQIEKDDIDRNELYEVGYWNPSGLELSVKAIDNFRNNQIKSEDNVDMSTPRMIFINTTLPREVVPSNLLEKYKFYRQGSYDDDYQGGKINFAVTPFGIEYKNILKGKLQNLYKEMINEGFIEDTQPTVEQYIST